MLQKSWSRSQILGCDTETGDLGMCESEDGYMSNEDASWEFRESRLVRIDESKLGTMVSGWALEKVYSMASPSAFCGGCDGLYRNR